MKRWLVLAFVGLAVIWGPYVYSELTSSPVKARGKHHAGLHLFGDDEDDTAQPAEDPAAEPEDKPEAPEQPADKADDPQAKAAEADKPNKAEAPEAKPEAKAASAQAKPEDPVADQERPTLPSDLLPAFHKVFDAEPRDAFWANDEEGRVRALFNEVGATPDTLGEIACRTTVCRVAFTPDELEAEALGKLYTAIHTRYPDAVALDYKPEPVGQRGTLYVLRAGYKLEH